MMRRSEKVNIDHFNKSSDSYDVKFGLSIEMGRARARFIREHAKISLNGGNVLDLGCGTGNLTVAFLLESMADNSIGLDISLGMLQAAKKKISVPFVVGSALSLPFHEASFDYCVGDAVLHHIVDTEACLQEISRVLKPYGMATFNEPSRDGYAFFEFVIRIVMGCEHDPALDGYLHHLAFSREHEGDLEALEAYPLPDKHVFSEAAIRKMNTGFKEIEFYPALDPWPEMWQSSFRDVLTAIKPRESMKLQLIQAAEYIDQILGDATRLHFCLHNQIFLYK
jgi:ubiquinone/menaquinone biosynthesis C-methylase UbiE